MPAGAHTAVFAPRGLPAGVYVCDQLAGAERAWSRMLLVK
jgi:hypothetical protein